jgi:hypothetical protein
MNCNRVWFTPIDFPEGQEAVAAGESRLRQLEYVVRFRCLPKYHGSLEKGTRLSTRMIISVFLGPTSAPGPYDHTTGRLP